MSRWNGSRLVRGGGVAGGGVPVVPGGILGTLAVLLLSAGLLSARQEAPFPHEDHQGLFPVCTGCHEDMQSADPADFYPPAEQCSGCHDGVDQVTVSWTAPSRPPTNVRFDHGAHVTALEGAGDPAATCESCHSAADGERMSVDGTERLDTCFACHAHQRDDHYVDVPPGAAEAAACESCHVPLAETRFGLERLTGLPVPADHEDPDFLASAHAVAAGATVARCATCHTQDRCAACHVDANRPEIVALGAAPAGMAQPEWSAEYPVPVTHEFLSWESVHEPGDEGATECSTCHTADDCMSCHIAPAPEVVNAHPTRAASAAPGVGLDVDAPASHASIFFMGAHGTLAASEPGTCATCHTETYCTSCHDGPADGGYHPTSFSWRHAAEAFGQEQECANCHNAAAFCRACHEESGLGSQGRLGAGYHDAEPIWLLRHGQPARQNLESCASCHQQNDCVQCHGVLSSFSVSPHTEDFDAEAAWARSPRTCIACHTSNPIGGDGG